MKKILLLFFVLFVVGTASAWTMNWVPPDYHFARSDSGQPIVVNQDFNLTLSQYFYSNSGVYTWGAYTGGSNWTLNSSCIQNDANVFRAPLPIGHSGSCQVKYYLATNTYYSVPYRSDRQSWHDVTMTLNCDTVGDYNIFARYGGCSGVGPTSDWAIFDSQPGFTFKVLYGTNFPPMYDYNLFWSKAGDTNRFYIHATDLNEFLDGNYFIKSLEVKTDDGSCEILGGGAMNLAKTQKVGNWNTITYEKTHKKFELSETTHTYQQGIDDYTGTFDLYIKSGDRADRTYSSYPDLVGADNAQGDGYLQYILIKFINLGIPVGATIASAKLDLNTLWIPPYTGSTKANFYVYPLWKYNWFNDVTWNRWARSGTDLNWGLPGAGNANDSGVYNTSAGSGDDRKASIESSVEINAINEFGIYADGRYDKFWSRDANALDVTSSLQNQLDNSKSSGWLIKVGSGQKVYSNSSRAESPTSRPRLTVELNSPGYGPIIPGDVNNINLYFDVQCKTLGFHDFDITITDGDGYSTDFNTTVLDINAYSSSLQKNQGPIGVNIGGPYYGAYGHYTPLYAESFGVRNFDKDINYLFDSTIAPRWIACKQETNPLGMCFWPSSEYQDMNCVFEESGGGDLNVFNQGSHHLQYALDTEYIRCSTTGRRNLLYIKNYNLNNDPETIDAHIGLTQLYVIDFKADLNSPYYVFMNEDSNISAKAIDNDNEANIVKAEWYIYDDSCGPRETSPYPTLKNQKMFFLPPDSNGSDVNTTGTFNCTTSGKKTINFVITADKNYYSYYDYDIEDYTGPVRFFRNYAYIYVLKPDSLRMEMFEVIPQKVRKGNTVKFSAVIMNLDEFDLGAQVKFKVFDEKGNQIDEIIVSGTVKALKQKEFSTIFDTTNALIKEKNSYRVTATGYLVSSRGVMQDKVPINDIEERYFWVLEADNKLQNLPETNFIGIIAALISVV
ncbi:MAG: hypothetical protein ABIA04_03830, partial [Pseudomonadota bacterium]